MFDAIEKNPECICVPFSVYSQDYPVTGFGNCTKEAWINSVKSGDDFYASDGKKGTNWKFAKIEFSY